MECNLCGTTVGAEEKFCPNCGARIEQPTQSEVVKAQGTVSQTESLSGVAQNSSGTDNTSQAPYVGTASYQNLNHGAVPPQYAQYNGAVPYPYNGMAPSQKKKKVWPFVLAICLVGFVLLFVIVVSLVVLGGRAIAKDLAICSGAQDCTYAVVSEDGEAFCDQLPPEFLTYLETTYAIEEDELEDQISEYLWSERAYVDATQQPAANGMDWFSRYYSTDDIFYSHDMPAEIQERCESALSAYGIEAENFAMASLDDEETSEALCMVQMGEDWYAVDAMLLAEELCDLVVGQQAQLAQQAAAYMQAYAMEDVDALHELVPTAFWEYPSEEYGISSAQADEAMITFVTGWAGVGTPQQFTCEMSNPIWYAPGDVSNFQQYNDYGLVYDFCVDIDCDYTVTGSSGSVDGAYTITCVEIEGIWYIFDVMMDYDNACYYAIYSSYFMDEDDPYGVLPDSGGANSGNEESASDVGSAQLPDENCIKQLDTYFSAVETTSAATMSTLVPDRFWNFLEDYCDMSQSEAEGCMTSYLMELQAMYGANGAKYSYVLTDVVTCSASDQAEMNEYLESYALGGETYVDAYLDLTVTSSAGESVNVDDAFMTFTKIDGTWYLYDAMYDYVAACTSYASAAGSDM